MAWVDMDYLEKIAMEIGNSDIDACTGGKAVLLDCLKEEARRHETLTITSYADTDEYKAKKAECWKQAKAARPFNVECKSGNEYMYFHKLYCLYCGLASGMISKEQAEAEDKKNFMRFKFDEEVTSLHLFRYAEWNNNIRKSEQLRCELAKEKDSAKKAVILAEIVEALTGDTTIVPHIKETFGV